MKEAATIFIATLFLILILLFLDYTIGYHWFKFIEPKKEGVRREIFLNTRSYLEGKKQDLIKLRLEYLKAGEEEKEYLKNTIIHMFAEYDEEKLPGELKSFLKKIKYGE